MDVDFRHPNREWMSTAFRSRRRLLRVQNKAIQAMDQPRTRLQSARCAFGSSQGPDHLSGLVWTWVSPSRPQHRAIANDSAYRQAKSSCGNKETMDQGRQAVGLKYTKIDKTWRWSDGTVYNPATDWGNWVGGVAPRLEEDACVAWVYVDENDYRWNMTKCDALAAGDCIAKATSDGKGLGRVLDWIDLPDPTAPVWTLTKPTRKSKDWVGDSTNHDQTRPTFSREWLPMDGYPRGHGVMHG